VERLRRACRQLKANGIAAAIASTHEKVAYLSGLVTPLPVTYPTEAPVAFPLSLVLVDAQQEEAVLVAADGLRELAERQCRLARREYLAAGAELEPPGRTSRYGSAVAGLLREMVRGGTARVGLEPKALPQALSTALAAAMEGTEWVDAAPALEEARRHKTPEEITALRAAARVGDAAQETLVKASRTHGRTEFEVWAEILQAVFSAASEVVPVYGELVTGPRTHEVHYPGGPRNRVIGRGDTGILDISVRVNGYWTDSCNTVVFGAEPSRDQRRYMDASKECFSEALALLKPGVTCRQVSELMDRIHEQRGVSSPRYYGHQIGVTVNEHPKLIPTDGSTIEAGMVFCVEPGAYAGAAGDTGARAEKTVAITDQGPEVLHRFPWGF